jgi:hypothetical protein
MTQMTNIPQAMEFPVPLREFIVSPGFAGAAAVAAALIVLCVVLYAVRRAGKRLGEELEQRERHHQETHDAQQHALAARQCWDTLKWVVNTAGVEPAASEGATLGLGPELAIATLRGLLRDAERLGDETLADAVTVHLNQFALVLAQQLRRRRRAEETLSRRQPRRRSRPRHQKASLTSSRLPMRVRRRRQNWRQTDGVTNDDDDTAAYRGPQR